MPRSSVPKVFRKRNSVGKPKIVVPLTRPESEVRPRPPSPLEVVTPNIPSLLLQPKGLQIKS